MKLITEKRTLACGHFEMSIAKDGEHNILLAIKQGNETPFVTAISTEFFYRFCEMGEAFLYQSDK